MNCLDFLALHGKPVAQAVAKDAGVSWSHFLHIAYGHRHASLKTARKLVAASAAVALPDGAGPLDSLEYHIDLMSLFDLGST